jgi:hypothetical protein
MNGEKCCKCGEDADVSDSPEFTGYMPLREGQSVTKKKLRYSFNMVLNAAEKLQCENMHHKKAHQHEAGYLCPAEYEVAKHCNIIREYMKSAGI